MQSSASFFLQPKSIHQCFVKSNVDIIPIKREAEEPLENQFIRKARITQTLQKIQYVKKWCNRYEQPSQLPAQVAETQKSVVNADKEDGVLETKPICQPEEPKKEIDQSEKKEETKGVNNQQETLKVDTLSSPNVNESKKEILLSSPKEFESQNQKLSNSGAKEDDESKQTKTEQPQQQDLTDKESDKDKVETINHQNNSQHQQKSSTNQKALNEASPRKNSGSGSILSSPSKTDPLTIAYNKQRIEYNQTKCRFFPNCEKKDCKYFHPQISCKFFPNCKSGISCMFLHKNCRYGSNCRSINCIYNHPSMNFYQKQMRSKLTSILGQASLKQAAKKVLNSQNKQNEQRNKKSNP